ncbi:hypothetical protein ACKQTC_06360 [Peptococcus simiae]|uniref:Colicin V production protein n=1 Tax=Peptococcus simiae TaxID=1643805 RepID=A0ABW9H1S7_9FIRM
MTGWDILVVGVIALALARGYRKGLLRRLGGWVGSLMIFFVLWREIDRIEPAVNRQINGRATVQKLIENYLHKRTGGEEALDTTGLRNMIASLPLPGNFGERLNDQIMAQSAQATESIYSHVAHVLSVPCWRILLFVLLWLAGLACLYLLGHLVFRLLKKVPLLLTADAFAGALVSACMSLVLMGFISLLTVTFGVGTTVGSAAEESFFLPALKYLVGVFLQGTSPFMS